MIDKLPTGHHSLLHLPLQCAERDKAHWAILCYTFNSGGSVVRPGQRSLQTETLENALQIFGILWQMSKGSSADISVMKAGKKFEIFFYSSFTVTRLAPLWENANIFVEWNPILTDYVYWVRLTRVIPKAPTFSLYEVVPFPVPQAPARRQPIPSTPIPRLIACLGGGGAPDKRAQA